MDQSIIVFHTPMVCVGVDDSATLGICILDRRAIRVDEVVEPAPTSSSLLSRDGRETPDVA
jgi:hypothetical protein